MACRIKRLPTTNPDAVFLKRTRVAFSHHKARAKKYGYPLPYTLEELREYLGSPWGASARCDYCCCVLTEADFCLDHAMPVGRRVDAMTWQLANLAVCCADCNLAKDRLTGSEFRGLLCCIQMWPPQAQTNVLARLKSGARRVAGK